jgi:hypothetical protein
MWHTVLYCRMLLLDSRATTNSGYLGEGEEKLLRRRYHSGINYLIIHTQQDANHHSKYDYKYLTHLQLGLILLVLRVNDITMLVYMSGASHTAL